MPRSEYQKGRKKDKFRKRDFVVIGVLWMVDLAEPWISGWLDYTFKVIFRDEDFEKSSGFSHYGLSVLIIKCSMSVMVSMAVDLRNRKLLLHFMGLLSVLVTPFLVMLTSAIRTYAMAFVTVLVYSGMFVTLPMRHVLIFNQKLFPSSGQTRKVVAVMELCQSLSELFEYIAEPEGLQTLGWVVFWVSMIPISITMLIMTDVIRPHLSVDAPKERTIQALVVGIRRDVRRQKKDSLEVKKWKSVAVLQFLCFLVLLVPILGVTLVSETFETVKEQLNDKVTSGEKADGNNEVYFRITNALIIPLIAVAIGYSKGAWGPFWDYVVLVIGHVINIILLIWLCIFLTQHPLKDFDGMYSYSSKDEKVVTVEPIFGKLVRPGFALITIIISRDAVVVEADDLVPQYTKTSTLQFHVRRNSEDQYTMKIAPAFHAAPTTISLKISPNKRFFVVVTAISGELQVVQEFTGASQFLPQPGPLLLLMNAIPNTAIIDVIVHELISNHTTTIKLKPSDGTTTALTLTPGSYEIWNSIWKEPVKITLTNRSEAVYTLVSFIDKTTLERLYHFRAIMSLRYNVSETNIVTVSKEVYNPGASTLQGLATGAILFGYVQFFWLECPLRLRTTILAFLVISNEITAYMMESFVTEITHIECFVILGIVSALSLTHIVLGKIYESKFRRELFYGGLRSNYETSQKISTA